MPKSQDFHFASDNNVLPFFVTDSDRLSGQTSSTMADTMDIDMDIDMLPDPETAEQLADFEAKRELEVCAPKSTQYTARARFD